MRLFTAVWPPGEALDHLDSWLAALDRPQLDVATARAKGFRFVPRERQHLTLAFHGDGADPDWYADRLDRRTTRMARKEPAVVAPRLRLRGCGFFRGVLWLGVECAAEDDAGSLRRLVRLAGDDPQRHRPHITLGRWSAGAVNKATLRELFEPYAGPWWTADELCLVASEQDGGDRNYRTLHRVPVPQRTDGTAPAPSRSGDAAPGCGGEWDQP